MIKVIQYWVKKLFISMLFMSFSRIVFLLFYKPTINIPINYYFLSLFNGIRFDLSTIAYIILPIWVILFFSMFPIFREKLYSKAKALIKYYIQLIILFSTIIIIFDIGFYYEFYTRINYLAIEYLNFIDITLKTIINQFPYNLFLAIIPIFIFFELRFFNKKLSKTSLPLYSSIYQWAGYSFLSLIILIIIMRGGFQSKPLNFSHSNISQYKFVNQLGINPMWNLAYSYQSALKENSSSRLASIPISIEESLQITRDNIQEKNSTLIRDDYPLLRTTNSINKKTNYNVVIILMESFAGHYVGVLGNKKNITPEFDKLSKEGLLFRRMFSIGSRTNRGLSGTLLSFPAIPRFVSIFMDLSINQEFSSMANILKQRNFSSNFIFSGDLKYDNMKGFLSTQGYDQFYGEEEFDDDAFSTSWGVSDEGLFNKSLEILSTQSEPFFSTILTMSNHPPYLFPESSAFERIKSNKKNESRLNAFKYSDWALGNFISEFKRLPLYERTIFVILGDHGFISDDYNQNTSIDLASYHIPCLVIAPGLDSDINNRIASQVDIIPTILDLLGGSFIHHSWGKSLLSPPSINDFAIVAPSGMNHIAGMIQDDSFLIYNFYENFENRELFSFKNFPYQYKLKEIHQVEPKHLEMKKTMLGYLKTASYALNTYKCGININE